MQSTPPLVEVPEIQNRLKLIFPEGTVNRNYLTRELAAKTVFVMLYIGAIEGADVWARPDQVTRMTDSQAEKTDDTSREKWRKNSLKPSKAAIPGRWYAQNTREPIRDETIRYGFIEFGAVVERKGLPKTSSKPRYALQAAFASLFLPDVKGGKLEEAILNWRKKYLSPEALARTRLVKRAVASSENKILVRFPNSETRQLSPGPSSIISKAVIEVFAPKFLAQPGVIWLSESGNKVVKRDDALARAIGIEIQSEALLPDIILVDLEPASPLIVFVEVVATDGPIDEVRKRELSKLVQKAGFSEKNISFLTAYLDRGNPAFQKTFKALAWNSFAWFVSEPESLISLYRFQKEENDKYLHELL